MSDVYKWGIQNYEYQCLGFISKFTGSLSSYLRQLKQVTLELTNSDETKQLFKKFLQDIRQSREALGTLESFKLLAFSDDDVDWFRLLSSLPCVTLLWTGDVLLTSMIEQEMEFSFFKAKIAGGFAFIAVEYKKVHIHFADDDNRTTVLETFFPAHTLDIIPFDISCVFNNFMNAPTDEAAFSGLIRQLRNAVKGLNWDFN